MKEKELRKIAQCWCCKKPFGNCGVLGFYRLKLEYFNINAEAIKRQDGLAVMLNSPFLAQVMGQDADIAKSLWIKEITICAICALKEFSIANLEEKENENS